MLFSTQLQSNHTWKRPSIRRVFVDSRTRGANWTFNDPSNIEIRKCEKIDINNNVYLVRVYNTKYNKLKVDLRYDKEKSTLVILAKDRGVVFMTIPCDYHIEDISKKLDTIEDAYCNRLEKSSREVCV